jgi:predicted dinucleotide-binding enzyme
MKIAFIGNGSMAEALAGRFTRRHEIFIGGRDAAKAGALAAKLGPEVRSGTAAQAATFGEAVVLATRHEAIFDAMEAAGGAQTFADKIIIDINNPVSAFDGNFLTKLYDGRSLAEAIAAQAPGAKVVKAFNMCQAKVWTMDPPLFDGRKLAVMYCGDDAASKGKVADLIREIGADPVDVGELKYARLLEAATGIVIKLLFSGRDSHTVLNLIQPELKPIA